MQTRRPHASAYKFKALGSSTCSGGICLRAAILAESLRHFSSLAVGEAAAILSEAKVECGGGKYPPLLSC